MIDNNDWVEGLYIDDCRGGIMWDDGGGWEVGRRKEARF